MAVPHPRTSGQVDDRGGSRGDGVHLGVDFVFGLVHFVLDPNPGCLSGGETQGGGETCDVRSQESRNT